MAKSTYWDLKDSGKTPIEVLYNIPIRKRPKKMCPYCPSALSNLFSQKTLKIMIF